MDLNLFLQASVSGVPLVFVVIGIVQWFKVFKKGDGSPVFSGNVLNIISMFVGLLLGGGYMLIQTRPPSGDWYPSLTYWFSTAVYGLAMGLVASGLYNTAKELIEKNFAELFKVLNK